MALNTCPECEKTTSSMQRNETQAMNSPRKTTLSKEKRLLVISAAVTVVLAAVFFLSGLRIQAIDGRLAILRIVHDMPYENSFGDKGEFTGTVDLKTGKTNGQGTLTYVDGTQYIGAWKDDRFDGQGTLSGLGIKYVGGWKGGNMDGQGILTALDGTAYVGGFKNGKRDGRGTMTYTDGSTYVGDFKNDKYDGQGTFTYADGRIAANIWKDGNATQKP